jgi:hypothetical protein
MDGNPPRAEGFVEMREAAGNGGAAVLAMS